MHDAQRAEAVLLLVGEGVVSGVGIGEFGFTAPLGDLQGRQHGGLLRALVAQGCAAVDMPVEGRLQVCGRGILGLVQGDRVNPGDGVVTVGGMIDLAEPAAEGDLGLRVEVQAAKDQNPVVFQRIQDRFTDRVVGSQRRRGRGRRPRRRRDSVSLEMVSRLMVAPFGRWMLREW